MPPFARRAFWTRAPVVTGLFLTIAVVTTWPLVTVMNRQIAGDTGDPLFNCWILLWTSGQVLRALNGDWSALSDYWSGNIFYPAPLTLAYSEHLTPQMLQMLPIFAATDNVILCYNLLFLSTIVLSGVGMYLLVRELTNEPLAAFLAGLSFACAPYRIDQLAHLQMLSSQWMPFALYGFRRFFVSGRLRPLVGGAGALLTQGLSCGYYLAYFTPFAVTYCLYELVARGKLADGRTWRTLVVVGASGLLLVSVFLWPYVHVRQIGSVGVRDPNEIQRLSADTHSYATIAPNATLWGARIRAMPRPEGQGFPGFTIIGFAATAVGIGFARATTRARQASAPTTLWRQGAAVVLGAVLMVMLFLLGNALVTGRHAISIARVLVTVRNPTRLLAQIAFVIGILAVVSPLCRRVVRGIPGSTVGFFASAAVAAAWLSLGPVMHSNGLPMGVGLYDVFYRWVPGFDGLRAPSRNFMLVAFFLSVLAGLGAARLITGRRGFWRLLVVLGMIATVAEGWSVPIDVNRPIGAPGYAPPPSAIADGRQLSPLYRLIQDLPQGTVVAEFPLGDPAYEILYSFYAGYHRKPIVNGYSGFFPVSYQRLMGSFSTMPAGDDAWNTLVSSGSTHAIVHEGAYVDQWGREVSDWLISHGARETGVFQTDRVFQLH